MQINQVCEPIWPVEDGQFMPLVFDEAKLSREAQNLIEGLRRHTEEASIYLRGSVLEASQPFKRADLDLFVVYRKTRPLHLHRTFQGLTSRCLDIKWLKEGNFGQDYVFWTLLAHRSLHVCGPQVEHPIRRPDAEFCWRHWVRYCLADLPSTLCCDKPASVVDFKRLARCYGVIMLLKDGRFTRDVSACLDFAQTMDPLEHDTLRRLRLALENQSACQVDIQPIKRALSRRFDVHWPKVTRAMS